jgi:hypothetical protein
MEHRRDSVSQESATSAHHPEPGRKHPAYRLGSHSPSHSVDGFFSVLHTWNQKLEHHPHAHGVVPAGGLSLDHSLWVPSRSRFSLPIPVLRRVFRRKFVIALKRNFRQGKLGFHGTLKPLAHPKAFSAWLRTLFRHHWHVYSPA